MSNPNFGDQFFGTDSFGGVAAEAEGVFPGIGAPLLRRREPAFTIAGRPVQMADWQLEAEANWGDRSLTGRLPSNALWAEQGAPIVVWRPDGELLWTGEIPQDPRKDHDGSLLVKGLGLAEKFATAQRRMFYRIDGGEGWVDKDGDPHNFAGNEKYDLNARRGALKWRWGNNADNFAIGAEHGFALWVEGALITRYSALRTSNISITEFDLVTRRFTGPTGTRTVVQTHALTGTSASPAADIATPEDGLLFAVEANSAVTPAGRRSVNLTSIKVYGRTTDDAFSASDVVRDVGSTSGIETTFVEDNGLAVLPLDWTDDHAGLLDHMADLVDWRWLVRGDGLYFGPFERIWNASSTADANLSLEPEPRFNRVVVAFESISGAHREAEAFPAVDPFPGRTYTWDGPDLEAPQPDNSLAKAVAARYADHMASHRYRGQIALGRVRDAHNAPNRSPYEVWPGDLISVPELPTGPLRVDRITYRPEENVTVEVGESFNPVHQLRLAAKERRRRKRRKQKR